MRSRTVVKRLRSDEIASVKVNAEILPGLLWAARAEANFEAANGDDLVVAPFSAAINYLDEGARLVIDGKATALWVSDSAERLLEAGDCLALRDGRLVGLNRANDGQLRKLVAEAIEQAKRIDHLFSPAQGEPPKLLAQAWPINHGTARALAVRIRPLGTDISDFPDLSRLFGLTQTEQRIVCMLLNGSSVRRIAGDLDKSVLTVRTHLKRTYSKMNIGTKEQLFSLLLKLMAG